MKHNKEHQEEQHFMLTAQRPPLLRTNKALDILPLVGTTAVNF
jgi:hypothetical protein